MSKTIDQRVVEMQFDNKNFEKNVSQSMSTIDKLKNSLNFSGASKGLDDLNKSIQNCDMSPLAKAAEGIHTKFSLMEQIVIGSLRRIGEQAVDTGEKLIKSLSIDNISAGWDKFGNKTRSVATLVSQGYDLDTVNEQLEKLNFFTDETSYNFTAMVGEISKFTAAGQGLEESVTAMQGIASWAALSGQDAATASRAMYQLSQAMGSGVMRKEDYKSIQNASMDTMEFRQKALDAAVAFGTLKKNADGTYTSIVEGAKSSTFSIEQFADNLTQERWFNSDVMMAIYKDYGKATNTLIAYMDKYSDEIGTASEAMDDLEEKANKYMTEMANAGTEISFDEALQHISLEELKDIPEIVTEAEKAMAEMNIDNIDDALIELGYGLDEFSLKAFKAGQEARTWGDVIDSVKDAVGTGWMNTFENIFGNYEEAKTLWTNLANELYDVFASGAEKRNDILKAWKEMGGRDALFSTDENNLGAIWNIINSIKDVMGSVKKAWADIFSNTSSISGAATFLWNLVKGFQALTARLKPTEETLDKITRTFKGLFAILDILITVLKVAYNTGKKIIKEIFGDKSILDFTAVIGDALVKFRDWIKENEIIQNAFSGLFKIIKGFIDLIRSLSEAIGHLIGADTKDLDSFGDKFSERFSKLSAVAQKVIDTFSTIGQIFKTLYQKLKPLLAAIGTAVGNAIDNIVGAFNGSVEELDISAVVKAIEAGLGVASLLGFKKIIDSIKDGVGGIFKPLSETIGSIKDAFGSLTDVFAAWTNSIKSDALMKIAKAILILSVSLLILASIEPEKMTNAIQAITMLFTDLVGSFILMSKTIGKSGSAKLVTVGSAFVGIATALLILSFAMKKLADMSWEDIGKGLAVMAITMQILPAALNKIDKKGAFKKALAMILLTASLNILAAAMKKLAELSWEEIARSLTAMAGAMIVLVLALNNLNTKGAFKKGLAMILLTASLNILAAAMKKLADLSWEGISRALTAMAGAMIVLVLALNNLNTKGAFKKSLSMILLMASMNILASAMKKISELSWEGIAKSVVAMIGSMTVLIIGINSINPKKAFKKAIVMLLLVTSLHPLASAMKKMAEMSWEGIAKAVVSMIGAMLVLVVGLNTMKMPSISKALAFIGIVSALNIIANTMAKLAELSWSGIAKAIVSLAGSIAIIVVALNLIGKGSLVKATSLIAIAVALTIMAGAIRLLCTIGWKELLIGIGGLVAMLTVVGLAANILGPMAGKILAVSGSLLAFSASMLVFSAASVLLGVSLVLIGTGLLAVGSSMPVLAEGLKVLVVSLVESLQTLIPSLIQLVVDNMPGIVKMIKSVIEGICEVIVDEAPLIVETLLTTLTKTLTTLSKSITDIVGVVLEFVYQLLDKLVEYMPKIVPKIFDIILMLLNGLMVYGPQIINKIIDFLITIFETLATRIPDVSGAILTFVTALFGGIITVVGGLIGSLIGEIANGIGTAIADGLPHIGEKLSEFSETINPFLTMTSGISEDSMRGVKALAETILAITAAELLSGVTSFMSFFTGDTDKKFGEKIVGFGEHMVKFAETTKDIDNKQVEGSANAAKALASFATSLPTEGGLWQEFFGTGDLTKFGEELESFGPHFASYAESIQGITNTDAIIASSNAALSLANLADHLPKHDGVWQDWVGDSSLTSFAEELKSFSPALMDYARTVEGLNGETVEASANAALSLVKLATQLPAHDGVWQDWVGDASLTTFAEELKSFAPALMSYAETVSGLDTTTVEASSNAALSLAKLNDHLPEQGGVVSWFTGEKSLTKFGENLPAFGAALKAYADSLGDSFDPEKVKASGYAAESLSKLNDNLPESGGMKDWFSGKKDLSGFGKALPELGKGLGAYARELGSDFNPESVKASVLAAESLSALQNGLSETGGLAGFFSGEKSLTKFAEGLPVLGRALGEYSANVSSGFDANSVTASATAAESLSMLQSNLSDTGGLVSFFTGEKSLEKFAEGIPTLGEALSLYSKHISNGFDASSVTASASAAESLSNLQSTLSPTGGVMKFFTGEQSFEKFSEGLPKLGEALRDYSKSVSDGFDYDAVDISVKSAEALSALENGLKEHGGLSSLFTGDSTISSFSEGLPKLGEALRDYSKSIADGFDAEAVNASTKSAEAMSELEKGLKNHGGILTLFTGDSTLSSFSNGIADLGLALNKYSKNISDGFNEDVVNASVKSAEALSELEKGLGDHGGIVSWFVGDSTLSNFASGIDDLGAALNSYSKNITDGFDPDAVSVSAKAAEALSELEKGLGDHGGIVSWFVGDATLSSFSKGIADLGTALNSYSKNISEGFDPDTVEISRKAAESLNILEQKLGKHGGFDAWVSGDATLSSFAAGIADLGKSLASLGDDTKKYFDTVSDLDVGVFADKFKEAGANFIQGFIDGMESKKNDSNNKSFEIGKAAVDNLKKSIDAHSPSKETYQLGDYFGIGFINALGEYVNISYRAAGEVGTSATDGLRDAMAKSVSLFDTSVDMQPTIKPVIDLTDVNAGISRMDGMFKASRSIAFAGDINATMNANGGDIIQRVDVDNSNVVDAIGGLKDEMGVMADSWSKMQVVMSTGELVGSLAAPMDTALGTRTIRRGRG